MKKACCDPPYTPTEEQIRTDSAAIRATWSKEVMYRRLRVDWRPQAADTQEVPHYDRTHAVSE
jgi:hypothetical protein